MLPSNVCVTVAVPQRCHSLSVKSWDVAFSPSVTGWNPSNETLNPSCSPLPRHRTVQVAPRPETETSEGSLTS